LNCNISLVVNLIISFCRESGCSVASKYDYQDLLVKHFAFSCVVTWYALRCLLILDLISGK